MSGKSVIFDDKKIKRSDFYKNKKVFHIDHIDANKILVFKEKPYGTQNSFKCFIGYKDNGAIRLLCVKLSQMTGYAKKFEFNSTMYFKISNKQLLRKYYQIWKKVEKLLKIEFNSKPVYGHDEKYIKKKKTYGDSVITNFHDKKMPKKNTPCTCLSIIMLDFVINTKKKYYHQIFLEESKYEQIRIKIENLIDDDLEKSDSDNDSNDETKSDIDNDDYDK